MNHLLAKFSNETDSITFYDDQPMYESFITPLEEAEFFEPQDVLLKGALAELSRYLIVGC